jgi:hypothetical protein
MQVPSIEANWAIDITLIQILNSFAKISITGVILGLEANLSIIAQSPWRCSGKRRAFSIHTVMP